MSADRPKPPPEASAVGDERAISLHHELVEALDDFVFMADTSGRLLAINRKARETLGWEPGEIGQMTIWDLHPPEDKAKVERERWRIVETGASSFEVRLLAKSGKTIPTRGRVTYSPDSGTFQGVYRDITEEQLVHERLLQVERLRALGEMASGVAHTFNNLLAVIGTTVQVAMRLTQSEVVKKELAAIDQTVYDGAVAVRRIQDFVRKRPAEPHRDLDLNDLVRDVVRGAAQRVRASPKGLSLQTDLGELPPVRGSASELKDVLLNLIFNAIDATPEGGPVWVRTMRVGERVALEVKDEGRGMTADVRGRLFTPFFSTKGERGSGLGLAIALNVVSQHGGSIEVDSEPGRGTTMRLLLPIAALQDDAPARPARVLLVETEPLLRTQLARAIGREGHAVEVAANGEAAMRLLDGATFDLVFTDAAMTPVSGTDVADRARARGARVVLLAGWGDEVTPARMREHQIDAVLRRPFPNAAVLNLIHSLRASREGRDGEMPAGR